MKTAYHYTGAANWESIQSSGLVPYPIRHPEIAELFDGRFAYGVMAWPEPHDLEGEIGSVLWQAETKQTENVVLLEVRYRHRDVKRAPSPHEVNLTHNGRYADNSYFQVKKPFLILRYVAPAHIALAASFYVPVHVVRAEGS